MSGWVSTVLGRQIDDRDRRRLFVTAAAVVIAVALLLVAIRPDQSRNHATTQPSIASTPIKPPNTLTQPAITRPTTPASVTRAASAFLAAYLPYLYGHPQPGLMPAASGELQRELAHQALVVPPAQSRLRPREVSMTATRSAGGWTVRALIADGGVADYPILLTLELAAAGRWLVSGVSG